MVLAPVLIALLVQVPSSKAADAEREQFHYLSVRVFGTVAAVRLQPNRKATAGKTLDRSGEFAVVDIWTRDGNAWKLSSRYLSRPDTITR